ncbi:InlB B-repeat-containing protein [Treponema denticola]|uniref:InlB B-repeat-containing protein n=1 Tax=Treponema denticola TaxID=158 RepID=UPI003F50FB52
MRKRLTFLKTLIAAVAVILLFTACEQFLKDPEDFLSYWASEAFVKDHSIGSAVRPDGAGVPCVDSSKDVIIMLTVHNPKGFSLVMPTASEPAGIVEFKELYPQPEVETHYDLERTSSSRLELTYKEAFLQKYEQGSGSLNPTITLKAKDGRVFKKTYTFGIKSNTPPPAPKNIVIAKTKIDTLNPASYYVLCLKFNSTEMTNTVTMNSGIVPIHKYIRKITINDSPYDLLYKEDNSDFKKPDGDSFVERGNVEKLTSSSPDVPSGAWVLYYKTNIRIVDGNEATSYTITLSDKGGVTSDKAATTIAASGPTHTVTFSVAGGTGTLTAKVDSRDIQSGDGVEQGKTVIFTANPAEGWEVEGWTFNGNAANGTSTSASLIVNESKIVTVKFKKTTYKVTFSVDGANGTLKATVEGSEIHSGDDVEKGKTVYFTATADKGWEVEGWTFNGNTENGTSTSASLIVNEPKTVTVKFKPGVFNFTNPLPPDAWKKLREEAEKPTGAHTITIYYANINAPAGEREITPGRDLTIKGVGASLLNANGHTRIFKVESGKTLTLENITLMNGEASQGGGIYNEGTLIMKGNTAVSPSEGGAGKNDVYLKKGKTITLDDGFSPEEGNEAVARITLEEYRKNAQVLTGSTVSTYYNRFTVTPENGTDIPWYINNSGELATDEIEVENEDELAAAINGATPGRPRLIKVTSSFASKKSFIIANKKIITIKAAPGITLTCKKVTTGPHKHFHVKSGKLTFSGNITLQGDNYGNTQQYALYVEGGTAEIKDNVTITGFSMNPSGYTFAGVYTNARLIMSGGTIKNGKAKHGGGVYIEGQGVFTMTGGTITGNTANHHGRALWIRGTFNWKGGTITGNSGSGDVLYIDSAGTINNPNGYSAS